MTEEHVTIGRSVGSYDFCHPSAKQANIYIYFPLKGKMEKLSACVEPDGEYDLDVDSDTRPEEVIMAIRSYYEKLWISSDKERVKFLCEEYFNNQQKIDLVWLKQRVSNLKEREKTLQKKIIDATFEISIIEEELEQKKLDNSQFGVGA